MTWEGVYATAEDINAACEGSRKALPGWSALTIAERLSYLQDYKEQLTANKDTLGALISAETGKPLWESNSEVDAMIGKVDLSAKAYEARCPERQQAMGEAQSWTRHKPQGVVAVLGPFNFPGHLPNGHIVPALLAGNTVVFKPSELTPAVAEKMVALWKTAGLPSGVLNLVQGAGETGRLLAGHPDLNGLFFTGSASTGQELLSLYSAHPEKILALEMGGNNPLVVSAIENVQAGAYLTLQSAFLTAGQRCTCARRLIVIEGAASAEFLSTLIAFVKQINIDKYTATPEPFMGSLIHAHAANHVIDAQVALIKRGGVALLEAKRLPALGPAFISPGIVDVTAVSDRGDEEVFGPLLQVIRVTTLDEAIAEANRTAFGLSAGLLSDAPAEYQRFYSEVRAGVINWNSPLTGASSAAPFGGVGKSGNHRPSAFYAADYCAYPVASVEQTRATWPAKISPGLNLPD